MATSKKSNVITSDEAVQLASKRAAEVGLRTFFEIAKAWGCSATEQRKLLGLTSESTYSAWKQGRFSKLSPDTLERLSYIVGIYKALHILFPSPQRADEWVSKPNTAPLFGGHPALTRMTNGLVADLYLTRQYLDTQLDG